MRFYLPVAEMSANLLLLAALVLAVGARLARQLIAPPPDLSSVGVLVGGA